MYEAPKVERYGTLRELTLGGGMADTDFQTRNTPDDDCISSIGDIDVCTSS
jgi:hypothetical protein